MNQALLLVAGGLLWISSAGAQIQDAPDLFDQRNLPLVQELLENGKYDNTAELCTLAMSRGQNAPAWHLMRMEALLAQGLFSAAKTAADAALSAHPEDLQVLMARHEIFSHTGEKEAAQATLKLINEAARKSPLSDRSGADLISLGQAALAAGADAQKVIQQFFEPAKKKPGALADACLALGELALGKEDYKRAAEEFRAGLKEKATSVELRFGLARSYQNSDRKRSLEMMDQVVAANPNHTAALCLQAEMLIGAEKFNEAGEKLDHALEVTTRHPEAWGLRAALALLEKNDVEAGAEARTQGLALWKANPVVDHTMGRILSRAYRFKEGSEHQRAALKMDATFMAAKVALCHDLFRLGHEEEAWKLAQEIREADGYNIQAHNIGLLEDEMSGFVSLEQDGFILRMPKRDRVIYADRALELLREARVKLGGKYGLTFDRPVLVEFFPTQQDFAIRTFGNLGGEGILGACFGTVVTMNSPGSLSARRSNWESTLWHEFCHVVTLTVTHNRMPRWLSEGISVYEEGLRDPACGMRMTTQYRRMILEEDALTPVGQLSSAFLNPKSGDHLMFAYYESSQVVTYIIQKYGMEKFQGLLKSLADGKRINEALAKNIASLEILEKDFTVHIRKMAEELAPKADFAQPDGEEVNLKDPSALAQYLKSHPNNLPALRLYGRSQLGLKQWDEALKVAKKLTELIPDDIESGCGYELAAAALRGAAKPQEEAGILRTWAQRSGDAASAYLRLIELDTASRNWAGLEQDARWMMAVNPFLKQPNEALAVAAEEMGRPENAVAAWQKLQFLGPDNPAEVNFRLARLMRSKDDAASRRYVLDALADAPRHRAALDLLEQIHQQPAPAATKP